MNRINKVFNELKLKNKKAFIPYITGGDKTLEDTKKYFETLDSNGASIIEIGIPFSDPLADGVTIQLAAERALKNNTTPKSIVALAKELRKNTDTPIVFLVYINTVLIYGVKEFINDCIDAGVDGLIIPDLPYEEKNEVTQFIKDDSICLVPLVAPTSLDRVDKIVQQDSGFIYCVSTLGVTGGKSFYGGVEEYLKTVRSKTDLPIAIGFGIRNRNDLLKFAPYVDGIICGSAIVDLIFKSNGDLNKLGSFCSEMSKDI